MAQEYLVTQFKKGDFQDAHGNYWCDMALKGVGEPVRIVVKDPMKYTDGMTLYGEVKEMTSQAGKEYLRFYREQRPEGQGQTTLTNDKPQQSEQYWEERNDAIKAQWALGRSYEKHGATEEALLDAKWLFTNAEKVVSNEASQQTGYDKFKASKPTPKQEDKAEDENLLATMDATMGEPINMDDIPF